MSAIRHLSFITRNTFQYGYIQQLNLWSRVLPIRLNIIKFRTLNYNCRDLLNKNGYRQSTEVLSYSKNLPIKANSISILNTCTFRTKGFADQAGKSETKSAAIADSEIFGSASNLGLFAKFKHMYQKYWYILIPVHVVTSIGWLGGFYYLSKSGVDVPALLQYLHLSESIIETMHKSDMGHLAVAYLCYKVATPIRYAVTLGGTTISIKYLVQTGHIKPIPSREQIMKIYEKKKADRAASKSDKTNKQH